MLIYTLVMLLIVGISVFLAIAIYRWSVYEDPRSVVLDLLTDMTDEELLVLRLVVPDGDSAEMVDVVLAPALDPVVAQFALDFLFDDLEVDDVIDYIDSCYDDSIDRGAAAMIRLVDRYDLWLEWLVAVAGRKRFARWVRLADDLDQVVRMGEDVDANYRQPIERLARKWGVSSYDVVAARVFVRLDLTEHGAKYIGYIAHIDGAAVLSHDETVVVPTNDSWEGSKRFYLPAVVTATCPQCGVRVTRDTPLMTYPRMNGTNQLSMSHEVGDECHEWGVGIDITIDVRPAS